MPMSQLLSHKYCHIYVSPISHHGQRKKKRKQSQDGNFSCPSLQDRVEVARPSLDDALQFRRDPAAVKVAGLWHDLLAVHEAIPRPCVE